MENFQVDERGNKIPFGSLKTNSTGPGCEPISNPSAFIDNWAITDADCNHDSYYQVTAEIVSVNLNKTGTITSTKCVANITDNYLVRNYSVNSNGSFAFSCFNSSDPNDQSYIVADSNCNLIQQRSFCRLWELISR